MAQRSLLFLAILSLAACKSKTNSPLDNAAPVSNVTMDSLRAQYAHYSQETLNDFPAQQTIESGKLYPVDEARLDTSFFVFRGKLLDIVREKNTVQLIPLIAPDIKADFGGADGLAGFVKIWELGNQRKSADSEVWETLEQVLTQGGVFSQNRTFFTAPYTFATFSDRYDAFTHGIVAGGGVRMRVSPSLSSRVEKVLTHEVVEVIDYNGPEQTINGETFPWVKIRTLDGKDGYTWGKFVVSSIDFRAGFAKRKGKWQMVFLVAGD